MMCGGHDGKSITKFWRHLKTVDAYKHHDLLHNLTDEELSKAIPFALHADGAEFHTDNEYFVISWCSGFQRGGSGNCLVSRYPISIVAEVQMADNQEARFPTFFPRTKY